MAKAPADACPIDAGLPRVAVAVAVAHRVMRSLIVDLLGRDCRCWEISALAELSRSALVASDPDLLVVDTKGFAACCCGLVGRFPLNRVVVIGREPDPTYELVALDQGAGAWLSGDRLAEELSGVLRATHAVSVQRMDSTTAG